MPETGNNHLTKQRLTIRVGRNTLSFSIVNLDDTEQPIVYEPYVVRSGVSMAANLREAFKKADLLESPGPRATALIDTPVLMVPIEVFEEATMTDMYLHSFPGQEGHHVLYNVLPDLNAVAVFSINKDLRLVLTDHFQDVRFVSSMAPVWRYLHQRSFTGPRAKLYGYFHEQRLEVFSYQKNRFRFCNSFDAKHGHDALYFLLYVWKLLTLSNEHDELHIVGDIPEQEWLVNELRKYLQKAYVINPTADFNRAPATLVKGMPSDLMTYYTKGR